MGCVAAVGNCSILRGARIPGGLPGRRIATFWEARKPAGHGEWSGR